VEQLSRRDILLRGGLVAAGIGASIHPAHALAVGRPVAGVTYRLDPSVECCCRACTNHAENKLFATKAAAEHGRAHAGCQCIVIVGSPISKASWRKIFGSPSGLHRTAVDRRWPATKRALDRQPQVTAR
jgi:hypothetical protein